MGSVLLWLTAKEDHDFDTRMYHMGCPVLHGHKWVVTKWVSFEKELRHISNTLRISIFSFRFIPMTKCGIIPVTPATLMVETLLLFLQLVPLLKLLYKQVDSCLQFLL